MEALQTRRRLSPGQVAAVRSLVRAVESADGHPPLSEHVLLHLPTGGDHDVRHLLVPATPGGAELAGYGHLDVTDPVAGSSGELAVAPAARGRGIGTALVGALLQEAPDRRLRLWAHGEHPAAARLAGRFGFERGRVLWQMRRPLSADLPPVALPAGVRLRPFAVGADEAAWTALNARAFAGHPEQGEWTVEEVLLREREPWFDPAGFLLAEQEGELVGFHWTKVHGAETGGDHPHPPLGEVYVVGVDSAQQGRGLGAALTLAGLHWLHGRGLGEVLLYVDQDNHGAVRVYRRLGFTHSSTDVMWSRGGRTA